jgi:hypothetical protein
VAAPQEGFRRFVVLIDTGEHAILEPPAREFGDEALDRVQPPVVRKTVDPTAGAAAAGRRPRRVGAGREVRRRLSSAADPPRRA